MILRFQQKGGRYEVCNYSQRHSPFCPLKTTGEKKKPRTIFNFLSQQFKTTVFFPFSTFWKETFFGVWRFRQRDDESERQVSKTLRASETFFRNLLCLFKFLAVKKKTFLLFFWNWSHWPMQIGCPMWYCTTSWSSSIKIYDKRAAMSARPTHFFLFFWYPQFFWWFTKEFLPAESSVGGDDFVYQRFPKRFLYFFVTFRGVSKQNWVDEEKNHHRSCIFGWVGSFLFPKSTLIPPVKTKWIYFFFWVVVFRFNPSTAGT